MDMQRIGRFLQELRKAQGLTQARLGERLGVTDKTVSRWETGVYLPPVEMLQALSALYGVSINELLAGQRLAPEAAVEKAEETLIDVLKDAPFAFQERHAYWRRKWQREHRALRWLLPAGSGGLCLAGALTGQPILAVVGWILLPVALAYLNNRQAAYVEHHLFDQTE